MLVKKFEAPSMKEALKMVKDALGPEAVILAAKDSNSSFGLMGKTSVEVTAAISEAQIQKRKIAEAKIRTEDKDKLRNAPARVQKDFIQKSVQRYQQQPEPVINKPKLKYIDLIDDEVPTQQPPLQNDLDSRLRVKAAASKALGEAKNAFTELNPRQSPTLLNKQRSQTLKTTETHEVLSLRQEVQQLKSLLESLKVQSPGISLHPGADRGLSFELSALYTRLMDAGISAENATDLCRKANLELTNEQLRKKTLIEAWAAKSIMNTIALADEAFGNGMHVFCGNLGSGKTSMLVRIASQMVVKERKRIAIVTTDTKKIGALDQLRIYSQILNVPFYVVRTSEDWVSILEETKNYQAVLVDIPGYSLKSLNDIDELKELMPPQNVRRRTHLVVSCNQKDIDAIDIARRYKLVNYDDVIFTRIDESANHGMIYNFQLEIKSPLSAFGLGPLIPEDFELASRERVVDLIFKLSKMGT